MYESSCQGANVNVRTKSNLFMDRRAQNYRTVDWESLLKEISVTINTRIEDNLLCYDKTEEEIMVGANENTG